jgi:cellulose biosynthesis protein BcsQ
VKTIVLANAKGGTGKTTVAVNLSACLALHHGKRVLGIDLDSQGNFGISYGVDPRQLTHTAYHMLTAEAPNVHDYITEIKPNLHLIPNAISPDLENRLEASHNRDSFSVFGCAKSKSVRLRDYRHATGDAHRNDERNCRCR